MIAKRLAGYTGDCLGAVQQVAEVAFLIGMLTVLDLHPTVEPAFDPDDTEEEQ
jgi:hypothetical protein